MSKMVFFLYPGSRQNEIPLPIFPEWRAKDVLAALLPIGEVHIESEDLRKNGILSYL
jgi:hypothetical protein